MRRLVLSVLLGGCHKLFGLDAINDIEQAESDASIDATTVNCPVIPFVYDEDGDSIDDRCDGCPTVVSDVLDEDQDGLPNACDLNLATFDKILFAATFAEPIDLTAFEETGTMWRAANKGTVSFAAGASLLTTELYAATAIEVRTRGLSASALTGVFTVGTTSATCDVHTSNCAVIPAMGVCAHLGGSTAQLSSSATALRKTTLLRNRTPLTFCQIEDTSNASAQTGSSDIPLGDAQVQVTTNASATAVVESIVIYGAGN